MVELAGPGVDDADDGGILLQVGDDIGFTDAFGGKSTVWPEAGGGPSSARSFTARALARVMSSRMAVEMAVVTKVATETGMMTQARMMAQMR